MGKMQRYKGARFERSIVKQLEFHDIKAKRVPLSGSTWLKGDIIANLNNEDYTLELKKRGNGFKQIYEWIDEADDPFKVFEEWVEKNKIVLLKIPEIIEKFDEFISKK